MQTDLRIQSWEFNKWRDSYVILPTFIVAAALVSQLMWANLVTLIFLVLAGGLWLVILYFFRDPARTIVNQPDLVVGPCDGKVMEIVHQKEDQYLHEDCMRISVFLSLFDVHTQRFPIEGTVVQVEHQAGKFFQAYRPEASQANEYIAMVIDTPHGKILLKQIAGILARRCINYTQVGDRLPTGQRFGLIKFGSRVDLFLPPHVKVLVTEGDKIFGGLSSVAIFPNGRRQHAA
jgi:phosphatidylserine decarboxylase